MLTIYDCLQYKMILGLIISRCDKAFHSSTLLAISDKKFAIVNMFIECSWPLFTP